MYHSFHDEVDHYRKHVWQCDGPCKHRPPYYGQVKRAINRAPGPRDPWWADHQSRCGGTYIKIKEPDKSNKKSNGRSNNSTKGINRKPTGMKLKNVIYLFLQIALLCILNYAIIVLK